MEGIDLENLPVRWGVGFVSDLNNYISTDYMVQGRAGVTSNNLPSTTKVSNFEIGNILIFKYPYVRIFKDLN